MYQDLAGDTLAYTAMWPKIEASTPGKRIAGNLCFEPEGLTRGEFLVMAMKLLGAEPKARASPPALPTRARRPLGCAHISRLCVQKRYGLRRHQPRRHGLPSVVNLTRAEAAVMLQNILDLPQSQEAAVFSRGLRCPRLGAGIRLGAGKRGISIPVTTSAENLTRREAAEPAV